MTGQDVWSLLTRQLYPTDGSAGANLAEVSRKGFHGTEERKAGDGQDDAGEATPENAPIIKAARASISYALCVGMPGGGKSSLLNAYLNPKNDSIPKPTVVLEYMFARRVSAANAPKDVAHIWELGGGSHVSELVRVPITPERFHNALYIIVVDLSKPSIVISHMQHWTDQIKASVKLCVRELSKRDPTFADTLKKKTYSKLGREHPDVRFVRPCPVPLLMVGNKYDIFKNQESVRKRTLGQALRFMAHMNGAALIFCSSKEKKLKDVFRFMLNTHLFKTGGRKGSDTNPERPMIVPPGADTLDAILRPLPPGTRREDFVAGNAAAEGAINVWKQAVEDVFGAPDPTDELVQRGDLDEFAPEGTKSATSNPFPERAVDDHRAQRDEILRRYRKDVERRTKLAMKGSDVPKRASHTASAMSGRRQSRSTSNAKGVPSRK